MGNTKRPVPDNQKINMQKKSCEPGNSVRKRSVLTVMLVFFFCLTLISFRNAVHAFDPQEPMQVEVEDGEYSMDVSVTGGSGKASVVSPTLMIVQDGKLYAKLTWSSSNYDYMLVGGKRYENEAEEDSPSVFTVPVATMDEEIPVIGDTTAMGTPHEVQYKLIFAADSFGEKSDLPQEAAKKVVWVALAIIILGGILDRIVKKKYYEE